MNWKALYHMGMACILSAFMGFGFTIFIGQLYGKMEYFYIWYGSLLAFPTGYLYYTQMMSIIEINQEKKIKALEARVEEFTRTLSLLTGLKMIYDTYPPIEKQKEGENEEKSKAKNEPERNRKNFKGV